MTYKTLNSKRHLIEQSTIKLKLCFVYNFKERILDYKQFIFKLLFFSFYKAQKRLKFLKNIYIS